MKVYHVKGPAPYGDADLEIRRSEIIVMKNLIMADGKSGYSEMLRVMSHPAAIARVRMIPGTHTLQWLLNSCIILGRVGIIFIVVLLLLRLWWWALGCIVIEYLIVCVIQTQINYEIAARLFVLDATFDSKFKKVLDLNS